MFDTLADRFDGIFTRLRGRGRLGDAEVAEVLREIRVALLEADVALEVVAELNEALTATLGGEGFRLQYAARPPTVLLLAGLQGSGKTTAVAKLARYLRQQG